MLRGMRQAAVALAMVFLLITILSAKDAPTQKREIPCKIPSNASSCYWTRGRLGMSNGAPAFRLWKIGTHRLLGIRSGPSVDLYGLDSEWPEFPPNVEKVLKPDQWKRIYADFEVCPLQKERAGEMQAACIESAKNLTVADK
jgi:hypothetical protein